MIGAVLRGLLVAIVIVMPALLLAQASADATQIALLCALLAFMFVTLEYASEFPSLLTFRCAPPFNRLRFLTLSATLLSLTVILNSGAEQSLTGRGLMALAHFCASWLDVPFSPVRLAVLSIPEAATETMSGLMRAATALSYTLSLLSIVIFAALVYFFKWPTAQGTAFNVWVNLPLFDPTAGGDVLVRLQRSARNSISAGILLPFILPALVKTSHGVIPLSIFDVSQSLIWGLTLWSFLPASLIMRGIALWKLTLMLKAERRQNTAKEGAGGLQPA